MNDKFDITKFGSRFNEFIYGGTCSTATSEVPETLTSDMIKEMAAKIGPPPPSFRVQYSKHFPPDEIIKVDTRKFPKYNIPGVVFNSFVETEDIWYIIGKNMIEKFQNEGIHVYGIKDNE